MACSAKQEETPQIDFRRIVHSKRFSFLYGKNINSKNETGESSTVHSAKLARTNGSKEIRNEEKRGVGSASASA